MHKKFFLIIALSHLVVPVSMLFPVLKVNEIRLASSGGTLTDEYYINLFQYIYTDIHTFTGFLTVSLVVLQILAVIVALFGLFSKKLNSVFVRILFVSCFLCAILAALQIYAGSSILFIISAISFGIIAFASVKLMKLEEKLVP